MENSAFQRLATEIHPALLNDIIEEMPSALLVTDKQGCIRALNQNFTQLTGYSETELLGKNCSILSYKRTPQEIYQNLWETIKSGKKWRGNLLNKKKNGEVYIADLSVFPISGSEHLGFYAIHEDVTEQFTGNQRLSNQNSIFETILNAAPVSFLMLNDKLDVVFSNSGLKQQIGQGTLYTSLMSQLTESISETMVRRLPKRIHRSRLNAHQRSENTLNVVNGVPLPNTAPAFTFQRARFDIECRDKGEYRWFECAVEPLTLSHSETEHFFSDHGSAHAIVVIHDRTKEKRFVEERRISTIQLLTAESKHVHSMQEVLMATIHQLQVPLNVIDSAVGILRNRNHACTGLDMMGDAIAQGFHALQYIQHAIPERPNEPHQATNINQVVRDACAISTDRMLKTYIGCDLNLEATLMSMNAIPSRLLLAVSQLVDNAIDEIAKSNPDERAIRLSTSSNQDEVMIVIEDSGRGIHEEDKNKIFEPFYSTKSATHNGCRGVGMSIVQQVMNDHHGVIEITSSRLLGGAKITLTLPILSEVK